MNSRLFPHSCDVRRETQVGTNGRMEKTAFTTGNTCLFIPMGTRYEIEAGFTVGSAYDVFFPDYLTDVRAGDQLVWNGDLYNVRAVRGYRVARVGHLHCTVTREGI